MLGELTGEPSLYGGMSWHGAVDAPAFEAFRFGDWVRAYVQSAHDLPKGKYKLWMYGDKTTKDAPVEEAVAMAVRVLERQNAIVELVIAAVMDELHGRGPDSGMWWYNALAKPNVTQMLACRTFGEQRRRVGVAALERDHDFRKVRGRGSLRGESLVRILSLKKSTTSAC